MATEYQNKTEQKISDIFDLITQDVQMAVKLCADHQSREWFKKLVQHMLALKATVFAYIREIKKDDVTALPSTEEFPKSGGKPN